VTDTPHAKPPDHTIAFRRRRFLNWFPLGLAYALLYMGRYNLTVAKTSLGALMTKEDFGIIFAAGTVCYAIAFLVNGPLVDRLGGRKGMITALTGSATANGVMGLYLYSVLADDKSPNNMRLVLSLMYAVNMYFQSFAAVSIVKVNAHWFHVRERGGFSGIFGTMISSGIFFAFTVNGLILDVAALLWPDSPTQWIVFAAPAVFLALILGTEIVLLRDRPGLAGFEDFDTGDASSGDTDDKPVPTMEVLKRILTNPIILTVAGVEFCTGVLRNGVMHWFPFYAKEVWVLPGSHSLRYGPLKEVLLAPVHSLGCGEGPHVGGWERLCSSPVKDETWTWLVVILACFTVAIVSGVMARKAKGSRRALLVIGAALAFLAPFFPMGWGGLLFVAGVIGGNVAGWVSDLFFQSRRAPAAGGLYGALAVCTLLMIFTLGRPDTTVAGATVTTADGAGALQVGDVIKKVGEVDVESWADIRLAMMCLPATCKDSVWDADACKCRSGEEATGQPPVSPTIALVVDRGGTDTTLVINDPKPVQRAGDQRKLAARPELPLSPWLLGMVVFLMSLCVIGTHGLLSGTATMDFGGRKAAATAVGVIDGFVYLGTAVQSISLGFLTAKDWIWWPVFLLPFAVLGFVLLTRIWNATARSGGGH
jgi:sugar phosphate permease